MTVNDCATLICNLFFPSLISHFADLESWYYGKYDFIVVGSGPAGCVVANRLSENPKWNVLLIEAGKVETFVQQIPVIASFLQPTDYNWGYIAEPQEGSCLGENAEKNKTQ